MDQKEKRIQVALGTYLPVKWKECHKLLNKSDKLTVEGRNLHNKSRERFTESIKLQSECSKLRTEGDKLHVESNRLRIEGCQLYFKAAIEVYGSKVIINWKTGKVTVPDIRLNND